MDMNFTGQESSVLLGLLAETTSDIIFKTDPGGFIVEATPTIAALGFGQRQAPEPRHLLDIVAPEARATIERAHARAVAARGIEAGRGPDGDWIEFPAVSPDERRRWFEICFRGLSDGEGASYGALGVMRSIDERRRLADRLFAATYTDPLTGLTNRSAFVSMLEHMLETGTDGCLAMFSIDFFRAINMKHGQSVGDHVLVVFADLLREMLRTDDMVSRIGSERFAVLLPRTAPDQAEAVCRRIVAALAGLREKVGGERLAITASGSVARIERSLDDTIERAELALFVAKAKGRNRLEMEKRRRSITV